MKFEWETIHKYKGEYLLHITTRAKVIGGWLIRDCELVKSDDQHSISNTMTFIADPNHEWKIDN